MRSQSLATWVFFLAFAFTRWPVTATAESTSRDPTNSPPPGGAPQSDETYRGLGVRLTGSRRLRFPRGRATLTPRQAQPMTRRVGRRPARVQPALRARASSRQTLRLVWRIAAGKPCAVSRLWAKDRPVTHCTTCGLQPPSEGAPCPSAR